MNKVLIVLTNTTNYANTDEPTGLWLGEAAEFVDELNKENIEYDFVSPLGAFVPLDPRSMKYVDNSILKIYQDKEFQKAALANSKSVEQINANDYQVIYYTGGHGVMWDFTDNQKLHEVALNIYNNGGYISSVCHGVAGILNIKDENGEYLIKGKKITGFTKAEEIIAGKLSKVPFINKEEAIKRGANWQQKRFYSDYAIEDDQFITGQNPFSVRSVAKLVIDKIKTTT